jgi:hypothetical protein
MLTRAKLAAAVLAVLLLEPTSALAQSCSGGWITSPFSTPGFDNRVTVLHSWDPDGPAGPLTPVIIAGGSMTASGSNTLGRVAQWNGSEWVTIGTGVDAEVNCFGSLPTGELFAGGLFNNINNPGGGAAARIARFSSSNSNWQPAGGLTSAVWSLVPYTTPTGTEMLAGGWFQLTSGARVARWTGTSWSGIPLSGPVFNDWTWSLAILPGNTIAVGGSFSTYGATSTRRVATFNGTTWSALGGGVTAGTEVYELFAMPGGDLIASGNFTQIGGVAARNVARYSQSSGTWSAMGAGFPLGARDFAIVGGDLYAADVKSEDFTQNSIARWDGTSWTRVANANGTIFALLPLANGDLLVGGSFTSVDGTPANRIAVFHPGAQPLTITHHPARQTICPGGAAHFSVAPTGGGTLSYSWRHNTTPILAAANLSAITSTLTISPAGPGDNGNYDCVITDSCGPVLTSGSAMLTICAADASCSGTLEVQDIFDFLNNWFAGLPSADFDGQNGLEVQDIFAFLNAWLAGC